MRALDVERAQVGFGPVRLNGLSQPNQNSVGHILRGGNGKLIDKRKDVYIFISVYVSMYVCMFMSTIKAAEVPSLPGATSDAISLVYAHYAP